MQQALTGGIALILAGCALLPASPQEIKARQFEAVPDRAVVYIAQNPLGDYAAGLALDDGTRVTTWPGTFYRWVNAPGSRVIRSSEGNLNASIRLQAEAGKIYFVEHFVTGALGSTTDAWLEKISDRTGRPLVTSGTLCCRVN